MWPSSNTDVIRWPQDPARRAVLGVATDAEVTAEVEQLAVTLQSSLWNGGLVRAAGVNDLVIAATAIVHGAVVLPPTRA